ncbi:LutC/YkgG family protein [Salinifilum ghardaiensis]
MTDPATTNSATNGHGSAREEVLGRVRSALRGTARVDAGEIPRDYRQARPAEDLVALFHEHVAEYRAVVRQVGPADLPGAISGILAESGARRALVPDGAPAAWRSAAAEQLGTEPDGGGALGATELTAVDAVVTTAAVGIASTGTIVLDHGPGQGRRAATLVPDLHVCVLRHEQIVDDVPAAMRRLDPSGPLTFISGPSATSDIELNRVEGVHGPRTLHVLIAPEFA